MKVEINLSCNISEPLIVIHTNKITDEIKRLITVFENDNIGSVFAYAGSRIVRLSVDEICVIKTANGKTEIHSMDETYYHPRRLYEFEAGLGHGFIRISKGSIVNLNRILYFEPTASGLMRIELANGEHDYISRKYLHTVKKIMKEW